MYQDIGLRNYQAIQRNGHKLKEKWKTHEETKAMVQSLDSLLKQIEMLFQAANIMVNR